MSSRDWSEFDSDGESSVHGNPIPCASPTFLKKLTVEEEAVITARGKLQQADQRKNHSTQLLRDWKEEKAKELIGEVPVWFEAATEAESYLDMTYQGQYSTINLQKALIEIVSLDLFVKECSRQKKIRDSIVFLDIPEDIPKSIVTSANDYDKAKKELDAAEQSLDQLRPSLPEANFSGWVICPTREDASSISKKLNFYCYDGQAKNARDKMVLTCGQAERLTSSKNPDRFIPENVFVYNEKLIVDIGMGVDLINIKKRVVDIRK